MPHSTHIHVLLSKSKHFLPNVHTLLLWYCIYFNSKAHRVRVLNLPACSSDILQIENIWCIPQMKIPQRRPMASIFKQLVYSVSTYTSLHSCKHYPVCKHCQLLLPSNSKFLFIFTFLFAFYTVSQVFGTGVVVIILVCGSGCRSIKMET